MNPRHMRMTTQVMAMVTASVTARALIIATGGWAARWEGCPRPQLRRVGGRGRPRLACYGGVVPKLPMAQAERSVLLAAGRGLRAPPLLGGAGR